jgi:alpha-tubulin suppressor-like RCC1 family protein
LVDPIKAVACGNQHTVVLTEKGEVYTYGIWSSFIFILNLRVRKWKFLN